MVVDWKEAVGSCLVEEGDLHGASAEDLRVASEEDLHGASAEDHRVASEEKDHRGTSEEEDHRGTSSEAVDVASSVGLP